METEIEKFERLARELRILYEKEERRLAMVYGVTFARKLVKLMVKRNFLTPSGEGGRP